MTPLSSVVRSRQHGLKSRKFLGVGADVVAAALHAVGRGGQASAAVLPPWLRPTLLIVSRQPRVAYSHVSRLGCQSLDPCGGTPTLSYSPKYA